VPLRQSKYNLPAIMVSNCFKGARVEQQTFLTLTYILELQEMANSLGQKLDKFLTWPHFEPSVFQQRETPKNKKGKNLRSIEFNTEPQCTCAMSRSKHREDETSRI